MRRGAVPSGALYWTRRLSSGYTVAGRLRAKVLIRVRMPTTYEEGQAAGPTLSGVQNTNRVEGMERTRCRTVASGLAILRRSGARKRPRTSVSSASVRVPAMRSSTASTSAVKDVDVGRLLGFVHRKDSGDIVAHVNPLLCLSSW